MRAWLRYALLLLGPLVLSSLTWRARRAADEAVEALHGPGRFVDMGVVVQVVVPDPRGDELVPAAPRLRVIREHPFGGIVDTTLDPIRFVAPSQRPAIWYVSEATEALVLHDESQPPRRIVYGAMGAGKTTLGAQWLGLRVLARTGLHAEIGATAPTNERTGMIARAIRDLWPRSWWRWRERDKTFTCANGVVVRLVSTHQQSSAEGSRVQGYTWTDHLGDEIQDQLAVDGDIEARGRGAPRGWFARLNTATAKDATDWRSWVDHALSARTKDGRQIWSMHRVEGTSSPFIDPAHWETLRATLNERDYQRKVLALDVGPERMVYHSFDRNETVRPIPRIGARDVTAEVLARFTKRRATVLVGHDPGRLYDVSVLLKAYRLPGMSSEEWVWWVVDEITTRQTTTEEHVVALKKRLREHWSCNLLNRKGEPSLDGDVALVRIDPYGNTDARPHRGVNATFLSHHLDARPAAYAPGSDKPGTIRKEWRIEMVVNLLKAASGKRRLFVDCDDRRQPVAPRLVEAFENSARNGDGEAETDRKDERDLSHWPAALGYALWSLERPKYDPVREVAS